MAELRMGKKSIVVLAVVGLLGMFVWLERRPLLAHYYVHRLAQAAVADRESWVDRVIDLDDASIPSLLACLDNADQAICDNLRPALVGLARGWGADDQRARALLERASAQFTSWNISAQECVLQIPLALLQTAGPGSTPSALTSHAGALLTAAAKVDGLAVSTLRLAGALVERAPKVWLDSCRQLAIKNLDAADPTTRVAAIQVVLRPPLRQDPSMLSQVVPLLKDSAAAVRKTALLAVGPAPELMSDDQLLPLLHDPDDEVQSLCELTLRSRGLPDNHILLARLITDPRPGARLQVLQHLQTAADLEPGVWLRRLCQDPAAAVRAAAARAAVALPQADLRDCLQEMARQDPSLTVRQLAGYYLARYPLRAN
jgi:hypothetical protein